MLEILAHPTRGAKVLIVFGGCLTLVFLGITDYLTGPELSFSIFYLVPIAWVTWSVGGIMGLAMAVAGATTWLTCDLMSNKYIATQPYAGLLIPYWNAFVRLGFFVITSQMLSHLKKALDREKRLATSDPLTGACNSRSFMEHLDMEVARSRRSRRAFSLAYIDVDNFKNINDTLGHSMGDTLLCVITDIMNGGFRETDTVARLGGDEFAVLMPETDAQGARTVLDRLRKRLLETVEHNNWPVTFSIGLATFNTPPQSANDVIKAADALMYEVKNETKNDIRSKEF